MAVIEAEGLVKIYRSRRHVVRALDGVDLEVQEGTVLGTPAPLFLPVWEWPSGVICVEQTKTS